MYPTRNLVNYSNLLKKMLPKDNELPTTTYEAKQLVCPLGLEVQKIHAPEVVSVLPTQMYKLHQHYMRAMADCIFMQGAKIKDFLRGEAVIWINWEEIYQLFYSPYVLFCMISTY